MLETAVPEEILVAAARLKVDKDVGRVYVDIICAAGSCSAQDLILKLLLSKIESISFNFGVHKVVVGVSQWRSDVHQSLSDFGYTELSGHAWPTEKQGELLKHTMILEFHKQLRVDSAVIEAQELVPDAASLVSDLEQISLEQLEIMDSSITMQVEEGDTMQNLVSSLFSALHASFPENESDDMILKEGDATGTDDASPS